MMKTFHPNNDYAFDLKGNFTLKGKIDNCSSAELIDIFVQDGVYQLSREWLGLISHYEVSGLDVRNLMRITFESCSSRVIGLKCGSLMILKRPMFLDGDFALIPGFPRFIINQKGDVKSRGTGRILRKAIGPYGYPYVNIYDPDKGRWRSVSVHILIAKTFIPNNHPGTKCYVNHKNGNKLDYRISNLEWSTSSENNLHAVRNDLRHDNEPCKVRDVVTGEITTHASIGEGLRSIGMKSKSKKLVRHNGKRNIPVLFKGRYEIKLINDVTDWFHSEISMVPPDQMHGPYESLNVSTGVRHVGEFISSMSRLTGVPKDRIVTVLRSKEPKMVDGFYFRVRSKDPWPESFSEIVFHEPRRIEAENLISGEILRFSSIRQATRKIGLDKRTLKEKLKNNSVYRDWCFREAK